VLGKIDNFLMTIFNILGFTLICLVTFFLLTIPVLGVISILIVDSYLEYNLISECESILIFICITQTVLSTLLWRCIL